MHAGINQFTNVQYYISMYNQSNRDRFRNIGNKSLQVSKYSEPEGLANVYRASNREKFKTEAPGDLGPDSLQLFQEEINSVLKNSRRKKVGSRSNKTSDVRMIASRESIQLKNQLSQVKNMVESQSDLKNMEDRLQKLLVQLQTQKARQAPKKQPQIITQFPVQSQIPVQMPMQQPMYYPYPPPQQPYYYPPPPPHYDDRYHKSSRRRNYSPEEDSDEDYRPKRTKRDRDKDKDKRNTRGGNTRDRIRTRLRIYLFVVAYTFFIRAEAKKLSMVRKSNLKKFWTQKFDSQVANLKNWFLDSQKFSLSIILQKKNLNLVFFGEKSQKVREEKKRLILQILLIGINKILQQCTPQKISLFSQILLNLCRRGSYAVSRFWTVAEMEQVCISEYYGFFRIDAELEKYLIGILVFVKIFIFNMFLQPYKFDVKNFPKKQQPITTNMKLISSAYYHMIKSILEEYRDKNRDTAVYKLGNWLEVKKQFIVECSEPLIYGNAYPEDGEYISGLFKEEDIADLKESDTWDTCAGKMKSVIEKLHVQMLGKGKMVKKNLKYKLYN